MVQNLNLKQVAAVIIGRNEGQRLIDCLQSILPQTGQIIYVDSGSTDGSVGAAENLGAKVVSLDMSQPFTAARARNAGFHEVLNVYPDVKYIQFVDGDCQVSKNWLSTAAGFLDNNEDVAVVCGRRKEIYPEKSIFNQLCDIEWNTPIGEAKACGGDALMRVDALNAVNGYKEDIIAGEEPELCIRIREHGWKVWRVDEDMTQHDANIMHFSQWWRRCVRAGHAYAEGSSLHGAAPEYHWVAESRRACIWGGSIPILILVLFLIKPISGIIASTIYPLQIVRTAIKSNLPVKLAFTYATFLTLGKFPEQVGQLRYSWNRYRNKKNTLIEYK